jgi:GMP synthase-like glutamine amidotransferase
MRLHYLQHVAFEDLGNIAPFAEGRGFSVTATRFHENQTPPEPGAYDALVVMGGPMNVYETEHYPWLAVEKSAIRRAIEADKHVLGVCLGAQLIADVLGACVGRNTQPEIGWFPVRRTEHAKDHPFCGGLPVEFPAFHWHGDTFELPQGAVWIASSAACANQAFTVGRRVLALQFHLETTETGIDRLLRHCASELRPAPYVQTPESMRADTARFLPSIHAHMERLLDDFFHTA